MKPIRKKVKFKDVRPGREFYLSESARVVEMKTRNLTSDDLPEGSFYNARLGNSFRYVDPDSYVWVQ